MLMFKNKNKKATNLQLDNLLLLLQKFKKHLQPMKKVILIVALLASLFACNKNEGKSASLKTAYIDTAEILEKFEKFKAEDEKFKVKSEEMGRPLEAKVKAFQMEAQSFQQNAQVKGPQWAQQKGAELSQREQQLGVEQNALLQQLQEEGSVLRDSIIKEVKVFIIEYGKKKGYDYIYGTGDAATILYSKDTFNITEEVLKELNDKYKASDKKEEKVVEKK
jgi:outer membrane protein